MDVRTFFQMKQNKGEENIKRIMQNQKDEKEKDKIKEKEKRKKENKVWFYLWISFTRLML